MRISRRVSETEGPGDMHHFDHHLIRLCEAAGIDALQHRPTGEQVHELRALVDRIAGDPVEAACEVLKGRKQVEDVRHRCAQASEAATQLQGILAGLLEGDSLLCHLERLDHGPPLKAMCRVGGQLRELAVHPGVPREELEGMRSWEYVRVHEQVVVGVHKGPDLFQQAHGDLVEFVSHKDKLLGLVCVCRQGHDEQIVSLPVELRDAELSPATKLVLQRDDPSRVIDVIPAARTESKFEVPVTAIHTRLEDLAGMESVVRVLMEDILLRLIYPEIRERFDLSPLHGFLLSSEKPGMGKTALMRALVVKLRELGETFDFEVALYIVKPNELKSVWHGGDAKLVRTLCSAIRARQQTPRSRPLFQFVVLDEVDSLGRRTGGNDVSGYLSSAQNDAVQSLLAEMDGMIQQADGANNPPSHVLWVGLTNRPDMVDDALKRPGRLGDRVMEMPDITMDSAEQIMGIYARRTDLPWYCDGQVRSGLPQQEIATRFVRPALAHVFPAVVLHYATEGQRNVDVTAGEILAGVHYMEAMNLAKKKAATRHLTRLGVPAVGLEDIVEGLAEQAFSVAGQMAADRQMLVRQLRIKVPVNRIVLVPQQELTAYRYLRLHTA